MSIDLTFMTIEAFDFFIGRTLIRQLGTSPLCIHGLARNAA